MAKRGLIRSAGRVTEVRIREGGTGHSRKTEQLRGGKKRQLGPWTSQSRRNCLRTIMACDWESVPGHPVFVTLSYAEVQLDGRRCRKDLAAFREAWGRQWGQVIGAWKLEFQARGAAHWHLVLWVPTEVELQAGKLIPVAVDRRGRRYDWRAGHDWVLRTWQRIVGPDTQIVQWKWWAGDFAWYFAGYSTQKDKEYQNIPPEESWGWGRRWGIWGIQPQWTVMEVSARQAYRIRRVLRGLQASRTRKRKRYGCWAVHVSSDARKRLLRASTAELRGVVK